MENNSKKIIFFSIFAVVLASVGGYFLYDYEKIKKANATIVSLSQAKAMAYQMLNN